LLRSAKSVKKTTNYGSCRDLHGRRLRDVQNERRLSEWSEKEGEKRSEKDVGRKNSDEEEEEEVRKEEEYKKKEEKEKFELETKQITAGVGNSVEKGLALMKEKELKRKREENNETKIKFFGLEEEEEEEVSDSESESESKEPEKKKTMSRSPFTIISMHDNADNSNPNPGTDHNDKYLDNIFFRTSCGIQKNS